MLTAAGLFEDVHIGAGFLLNCLLLYAIRRFTRKSFGAYKQLLTIFAIVDIFLIILHALVKQKVVIVGTTFGVVNEFQNRNMTGLYCSSFTVPFALMNIHFLYRYWSVKRPHLILLFSTKKFIALVSAFPVAIFIIWYVLCIEGTTGEGMDVGKAQLASETAKRYGKALSEGWLVMSFWDDESHHFRVLLTLFGFNAVIIVSFTIAATLGGLTLYHIHSISANLQSLQSHNLQMKLFIAMCAQTLVPTVFVYIPYTCVLNLPFFRLPTFFMDDACTLLISCYPAWDAVIMIALIKDYRKGVVEMIWKTKDNGIKSVWNTAMASSTITRIN